MKNSINKDFEILSDAINFAKKRGYIVPPMEYALFVVGGRQAGKTSAMRTWALGLVYSHDFLKAFFGEEMIPREEDSNLMFRIGIWAEQVAVEYQNKLYKAREGDRYVQFAHYPDVDMWASKAPTEVIAAEKVVMELQDMSASIPVMTHKIKSVKVDNITLELPAWKHGLRQMTEYDNPFLYLKRFMDYNKKYEVAKEANRQTAR